MKCKEGVTCYQTVTSWRCSIHCPHCQRFSGSFKKTWMFLARKLGQYTPQTYFQEFIFDYTYAIQYFIVSIQSEDETTVDIIDVKLRHQDLIQIG
jgi:hypothetical protein